MDIKIGLYQHFRGNFYQVIGVARHSETLEPLVVYQALYGSYGIWVRPYDLFFSKVMHNGTEVKRFEFLKENLNVLPELR